MAEYEVDMVVEWVRPDTSNEELAEWLPIVRRTLAKAGARGVKVEVTRVPKRASSRWYAENYRNGRYEGTLTYSVDVDAKSKADAIEKAEGALRDMLRKRRFIEKRPDETWAAFERRERKVPGMAWCRGPKVTVVV